jgi:hypothetical protein
MSAGNCELKWSNEILRNGNMRYMTAIYSMRPYFPSTYSTLFVFQMQTEYRIERSKHYIAKAKKKLSWWERVELTYYRYTLESAAYVMSREERWLFNSALLVLLAIIIRRVSAWIGALFL